MTDDYLTQRKDLLDKANSYYWSNEEVVTYFGRMPKSRYWSFRTACDHLKSLNRPLTIVELGTSRSFVDGRFPGCNSDDKSYWEPDAPEKWDWSAGLFTHVFAKMFPDSTIHTVDLCPAHIRRCQYMNKDSTNIQYHVASSENFLKSLTHPVDLIYLDTGDMTPIEPTAQLQLREARIVTQKNLIRPDGLVLIDDVRNLTPKRIGETSDYGKAKYSIPHFEACGYVNIFDEYQVVLKPPQEC